MRIGILGGTGFIGNHVLNELLKETDYKIKVLFHNKKPDIKKFPESYRKKLKLQRGDVNNVDDLNSFLKNTDAVINAIGIIEEIPPNKTFKKIHVDLVSNTIGICREYNIKRFIHISALGTNKNARGGYYTTKWEAEEIIRSSDLNYTILRPSIVWDSDSEFATRLKQIIKIPLITPIVGSGKNKIQPISVKDLAKIINLSVRKQETFKKTFEVGGRDKYTFNEFIIKFESQLGRKKHHFHIPTNLVKLSVKLASKMHLPLPITMNQLDMIQKDNITNENKLYELIGFQPNEIFN